MERKCWESKSDVIGSEVASSGCLRDREICQESGTGYMWDMDSSPAEDSLLFTDLLLIPPTPPPPFSTIQVQTFASI